MNPLVDAPVSGHSHEDYTVEAAILGCGREIRAETTISASSTPTTSWRAPVRVGRPVRSSGQCADKEDE